MLLMKGIMTKKYLVVTKVDGKLTMLSFSSNSSQESELESECGQMLAELFTGHRLDEYFVQPWPISGDLDGARQPRSQV